MDETIQKLFLITSKHEHYKYTEVLDSIDVHFIRNIPKTHGSFDTIKLFTKAYYLQISICTHNQ